MKVPEYFFKKPPEISRLATVSNTKKLKTHCFPKECYKRKIHFFAVVLAWYWSVAFQFNVKFQRKSTYPCTMKLNVDYHIRWTNKSYQRDIITWNSSHKTWGKVIKNQSSFIQRRWSKLYKYSEKQPPSHFLTKI